MKKLLLLAGLMAVGSLLAISTPVFAGGADTDGVGYHCYIFAERPDVVDPKTGEETINYHKEHWQFMTQDEDQTQIKAEVLKKVPKKQAKGFNPVMSVGNLDSPILLVVLDEFGNEAKFEACAPPEGSVHCPPGKLCKAEPAGGK